MLELIAFFTCLEFAILNSAYNNIILKPKQVVCLETIYKGNDLICILPTGYGKSLIFHLIPCLMYARNNKQDDSFVRWKSLGITAKEVSSIIIVISPLNALIQDQISRLGLSGLRASAISVKDVKNIPDEENFDSSYDFDFKLCEKDQLESGLYHIVFAHPESLISTKFGRSLMLSEIYQKRVVSIVVDEAHCILDWGSEFRTDYGKLGVVCASFPDIPVVAMTATASVSDIGKIKESIGLKKCKLITSNPDRSNIFYRKVFRSGKDIDAVQSILTPIANQLLTSKRNFPLTVIYLPLRWCGFAYRLFQSILGQNQYYPEGAPAIPENRLFAQFHAPQTSQMKVQILKQMCSTNSIVRVVFATVAIGMGVDVPNIRQIVHVCPPCSVKQYFQETGRAGRDGEPADAILYYNNRDIATNRSIMQNDMREFCNENNDCLRRKLLKSLDYDYGIVKEPLHLCCSVCEKVCKCIDCFEQTVQDFEEL